SISLLYCVIHQVSSLHYVDYSHLDYIRGRGNSTWQADKKPYKLKLDKGANLLGMGKNKHWVLLANRMDNSQLRNRLISYMGNKMGLAYTPKMLPVDVVINGEYYGSYLLAQQIRIDDSRVDIEELSKDDNEEPAVTGGYLFTLKGDHDEDGEDNSFVTENGMKFIFDDPAFDFSDPSESGTKEQKEYITSYLQKVENAIMGENFCDENGVSYTEYMDIQSTADYWWIQVITDNFDAYRTSSTYLYKDRNGKLCWGPLWDYDLSLGNSSGNGLLFNVGVAMPWLDHLRAYDPAYLEQLMTSWEKLDGIIDEVVADGGVIDEMADEIRQSWQADADKWGEWIASIKPLTDLDTEVADLKTYLKSRQEWVKDNLDSITKVYCTVKFEADGEVFHSETVRLGEEIGTLPEAPEKEGYTFAGWYDAEGELIEFLFPMDDMTATAKYEKIQDEEPKPEDTKPADEDSKPDDDNSADDTSDTKKDNTDKADDTSSPESGADSEPKAAAATSNPKTNAVQGLGVLTIAAAAIIITAKKKHR
ncbi:MAG: CotH kinase family protein, partial [Ruminococcus sp.]|nr:CotH kinase family protein [Ruminococcus sp.]